MAISTAVAQWSRDLWEEILALPVCYTHTPQVILFFNKIYEYLGFYLQLVVIEMRKFKGLWTLVLLGR